MQMKALDQSGLSYLWGKILNRLGTKADLVNGKVPLSQLPASSGGEGGGESVYYVYAECTIDELLHGCVLELDSGTYVATQDISIDQIRAVIDIYNNENRVGVIAVSMAAVEFLTDSDVIFGSTTVYNPNIADKKFTVFVTMTADDVLEIHTVEVATLEEFEVEKSFKYTMPDNLSEEECIRFDDNQPLYFYRIGDPVTIDQLSSAVVTVDLYQNGDLVDTVPSIGLLSMDGLTAQTKNNPELDPMGFSAFFFFGTNEYFSVVMVAPHDVQYQGESFRAGTYAMIVDPIDLGYADTLVTRSIEGCGMAVETKRIPAKFIESDWEHMINRPFGDEVVCPDTVYTMPDRSVVEPDAYIEVSNQYAEVFMGAYYVGGYIRPEWCQGAELTTTTDYGSSTGIEPEDETYTIDFDASDIVQGVYDVNNNEVGFSVAAGDSNTPVLISIHTPCTVMYAIPGFDNMNEIVFDRAGTYFFAIGLGTLTVFTKSLDIHCVTETQKLNPRYLPKYTIPITVDVFAMSSVSTNSGMFQLDSGVHAKACAALRAGYSVEVVFQFYVVDLLYHTSVVPLNNMRFESALYNLAVDQAIQNNEELPNMDDFYTLEADCVLRFDYGELMLNNISFLVDIGLHIGLTPNDTLTFAVDGGLKQNIFEVYAEELSDDYEIDNSGTTVADYKNNEGALAINKLTNPAYSDEEVESIILLMCNLSGTVGIPFRLRIMTVAGNMSYVIQEMPLVSFGGSAMLPGGGFTQLSLGIDAMYLISW